MPSQHSGNPFHRLYSRSQGLCAPTVQGPTGPVRGDIAPEELELLLEEIGADRFEVVFEQVGQARFLLVGPCVSTSFPTAPDRFHL